MTELDIDTFITNGISLTKNFLVLTGICIFMDLQAQNGVCWDISRSDESGWVTHDFCYVKAVLDVLIIIVCTEYFNMQKLKFDKRVLFDS